MTTRSQKRKAVEELVSTEIETPVPEISLNENPVAGTSKSPRVFSENLENIKSALRKEIMTDLTKILAENQKEMLKLIAPVTKKQTIVRASEETDSDPENIPENATSTPIKPKSTATTNKITPINSRNKLRRDVGHNLCLRSFWWRIGLSWTSFCPITLMVSFAVLHSRCLNKIPLNAIPGFFSAFISIMKQL